MKTLIVGDLHGKIEVVERALAQEHPVIFVGDILDSFERPITDHLKCLELIFSAIDSGKAQCLYGNHELSYLYYPMRCSGYHAGMMYHIQHGLREEMEKRFKYFLFYKPNILITHAGLDRSLWIKHGLSLENLKDVLNVWCRDISNPAWQIGRVRGGTNEVGGIFWCDFNMEFEEIPELVQIFGHTIGKNLRQKGNSYCIDYHDYIKDQFYYDLPEGE